MPHDVVLLAQALSKANASSYLPRILPPPLVQPPPPVNGTDPPQIAAVYTARDFQWAFHEGIRDIELHAHMDLRQAATINSRFQGVILEAPLGGVRETTRSVRVRRGKPCPPSQAASCIQ